MLSRARRHPVLLALAAGAVLAVTLAGAATWYVVGEEWRSGRLLSGLLTREAGTPVLVERARLEGPARLVLYNVHVPPGPRWTGDVRVRELTVDGGIMPILFPRGRALSVVAVSTSVTLGGQRELTAPTADGLEALRRLVMQVIDWPAVLSLDLRGGELRSGDQRFAFDLRGEKTAAGTLNVALHVSSPAGEPALSLDLAGHPDGGALALRVGVDGAPGRLGALWPAALPALARLALRAEGRLRPGGDLELAGQARAERTVDAPPITAEFVSTYHAAAAQLELSRLALAWGERVRLAGGARVEAAGDAAQVALDLAGIVEGTPVKLAATYAGATGAVSARLETGGVDAARVLGLLGLEAPPTELAAAAVRSSISGSVERGRLRASVDATVAGLRARALLPGAAFDGTLRATATLDRGPAGLELVALGPTTLTLERDGAPVALVTARSPEAGAWPLAVEATLPDLRRLPSASSLPAALSGRAVVRGRLDHARFAGAVAADLPRVEVRFASPIVATNAHAEIPVAWGGPAPAPGRLSIERVTAYGFALDGLTGSARFADGQLMLADLRYTHYGGGGRGWIEAAVDHRPVPLRARIEGEHVDLAALTREYGLTVARLRGSVRYLLVFQHSAARGLTAVGQVDSEGEGEVGIDAIEKLLGSAKVQAESTGLLRQTLQSLRVFKYASLDAEVRVTRDGGHVNLSLVGKKRLGIFPAPVKAINLSNVPLTLLERTFSRKETP